MKLSQVCATQQEFPPKQTAVLQDAYEAVLKQERDDHNPIFRVPVLVANALSVSDSMRCHVFYACSIIRLKHGEDIIAQMDALPDDLTLLRKYGIASGLDKVKLDANHTRLDLLSALLIGDFPVFHRKVGRALTSKGKHEEIFINLQMALALVGDQSLFENPEGHAQALKVIETYGIHPIAFNNMMSGYLLARKMKDAESMAEAEALMQRTIGEEYGMWKAAFDRTPD